MAPEASINKARAKVTIRLISGSLSYSRLINTRSAIIPMPPTRIGDNRTAGQPSV